MEPRVLSHTGIERNFTTLLIKHLLNQITKKNLRGEMKLLLRASALSLHFWKKHCNAINFHNYTRAVVINLSTARNGSPLRRNSP